MPKEKVRKRQHVCDEEFDELCEECVILIEDIEEAFISTLAMSGDEKIINAFQWLNKCNKHVGILRKALRRMKLSSSKKQRCINLIGQIEYLCSQFNLLLKRGAGLEVSNERVRWVDSDVAFKHRLQTGLIINLVHKDVSAFLDDAFTLFEERIRACLNSYGPLKVYTVFVAKFRKVSKDGDVKLDLKSFIAETGEIFPTTLLDDWFNDYVKQPTLKKIEEFQEEGSDWKIDSIQRLEVNINKYNPMRASSYIDLPDCIKKKHACINIQNSDNQCFKWSILSALYPTTQHSNRVSSYRQYENILHFTGIEFPVALKDIPRFEIQNAISINVYGLLKRRNKFTVVPLCVTSQKRERHVNLLRIEDHYIDENLSDDEYNEDEDFDIFNYHYVWIKDLSRLVGRQLSKNKRKKYICDRCLHYFANMQKLNDHIENCKIMNHTRIMLPKRGENNIIEFKNFNNKEKVPFIMYADCESLLIPAEESQQTKSNTEVIQHHKLLSIGYYLKCSYDDSLSVYKASPREEKDPAKWLAKELQQLAEDAETVFMCPIPMEDLTPEQKKAFNEESICHICEKYIALEEKKVMDHSHLTGKYRGPAHQDCNLNYQDSRTIPVVFHNLSGYDAHFIINAIATEFVGRVDLLPLNKEKYIGFTKNVKGSEIKFRFIDSFRFMASSLDKLASYLDKYDIVSSVFSHYSTSKIELLTRKGIFPYEYFDSKEKLKETQLPPIERFYSMLNDSTVSVEDYAHAQRVWTEFNCTDLGDYVYLYMKTDILLLADIFENFRSQCLKVYGLDPAHYYTTPSLTWDAMLKYTRVNLELLTDIDQVMFIERGIKGGVTQCPNRYAKANNPYMEFYNEDNENVYIVYFDANNLYGWAMVQALPYGGFEWVTNVDNSFNFNVPDDSPIGYILEVDLDYPQELHDTHNDLPFCPEHSKPPGSKQEKLLTTLLPKRKYVIHYRALKQALANGLKLIHIHRVLKFQQSMWLKSYIDFNTMMRMSARNEFEKNLFKLMNNAVYGKTMENVRKHVDVKLVTKWGGRYGAEALVSKPNFHSRAIFNENLVAVELRKTEVLMNKPIYVGLSVLDISKTLIYDFHYTYMLPKYNKKCKLLYTDTDSLIYEVKCNDIYADMKEDIHKFDTSDYPFNNVYNIPQVNKKVLGLMKDECSGKVVTEFVGLRSKMYSIRVNGDDLVKKAKGVKTIVVEKTITFEDYIDCLRNAEIQTRTQYCIRSRLHNVQTVKQTKIALSPFDDKRYLLPESTDTLAWGHYKINDDELDENDLELLDLLLNNIGS